MMGLILGLGVGAVAALLLLGAVLTVNIEREGSVDETSLETANGVVYRTFTIEGEVGVMVGKNPTQFLTRADLKEMLKVLDHPGSGEDQLEKDRK